MLKNASGITLLIRWPLLLVRRTGRSSWYVSQRLRPLMEDVGPAGRHFLRCTKVECTLGQVRAEAAPLLGVAKYATRYRDACEHAVGPVQSDLRYTRADLGTYRGTRCIPTHSLIRPFLTCRERRGVYATRVGYPRVSTEQTTDVTYRLDFTRPLGPKCLSRFYELEEYQSIFTQV